MRGAMSASPAAATRTASSSRSAGVSLSRNPVAPMRSALKTYSLASKVVSITTAVVFSGSARIRSAAASPSSSGMRMSISTTSGRRRATTSTAA